MRAAPLSTNRPAPHRLERADHVAGGWSFDDDSCVTPPRAMPLQHACCPLSTDSDAARDTDALVYHEKLAVITRNEPHPAPKPGRVEDFHVHARAGELANERTRCSARTDPVEQEPSRSATLDGSGQRLAKAPSHLVGPEDVALERNRSSSLVDELDHGVEGCGSVA